MQEAVGAAQGLEIRVTLADEGVCIGFVQMHLDDLRTIMASTVDENSETIDADAVA